MRRTRVDKSWPAWRYGPNGAKAVFKQEADVPEGWTKKPWPEGYEYVPPPKEPALDRMALSLELKTKGIKPLGWWSTRYMKELLEQ